MVIFQKESVKENFLFYWQAKYQQQLYGATIANKQSMIFCKQSQILHHLKKWVKKIHSESSNNISNFIKKLDNVKFSVYAKIYCLKAALMDPRRIITRSIITRLFTSFFIIATAFYLMVLLSKVVKCERLSYLSNDWNSNINMLTWPNLTW